VVGWQFTWRERWKIRSSGEISMFRQWRRRVGFIPALVGAVGAIFAGGVATAECSSYGCIGYVDEVYIEANGGVWLQTSGNELLANCTADSGVFLHLPGDSAKFKEVYAMLLSAQLTNRQVFVRIQEGSNPCRIIYVRLIKE
jgi:hypothetical protein